MTSFSDFDYVEFFTDIANTNLQEDCRQAIKDTIIEQLGELRAIEQFAEYHGLIESEAELSERFDDENADWLEDMNNQGDQVAINEHFSNWSDHLCRNGLIHSKQYREYCYVGKYAKD